MENKKYYIPVNGNLVEVSEEIYRYHTRTIANERARARRDQKCGQPDYRKCTGDCGHCRWVTDGKNMISYEKVFLQNEDVEGDFCSPYIASKNERLIDEIVSDRLLLSDLFKKLDTLVPDGGQICKMLMDECTEREIASRLNVSSQSTVNYRARKVRKYLQEHWDEIFKKN